MSKRIIALAILGAALIAGPASATTWSYTGSISACNAEICNLVPVATGDPVVGSLTIDVGANDGIVIDNTFMDFSFLVGGVIPVEFPAGDPPQGVLLEGLVTTDASGDFDIGFLAGTFVGGQLGGLLAEVVIDLATGDMLITAGLGTVFVAAVEGDFAVVPIPAAVWLMGSAVLGLAGLRRRKIA